MRVSATANARDAATAFAGRQEHYFLGVQENEAKAFAAGEVCGRDCQQALARVRDQQGLDENLAQQARALGRRVDEFLKVGPAFYRKLAADPRNEALQAQQQTLGGDLSQLRNDIESQSRTLSDLLGTGLGRVTLRNRWQLVANGLPLVVAAVLIFWLIGRLATGPLAPVSAAARHFPQGDFRHAFGLPLAHRSA